MNKTPLITSWQLYKIHTQHPYTNISTMNMQNFSCLDWNIRGCNNIKNRRNANFHIKANRVNFLCLQETNCLDWDRHKQNSLWDYETHGWLVAPPTGLSGGLLTSWDNQHFSLVSSIINRNWIFFMGRTVGTDQRFIVINVYAPQHLTDKAVI